MVGLRREHLKSFRHTSSFAAFELMDAFIQLALVEEKQLSTWSTQYQTEKQKKSSRNSAKLKQLKSDIKAIDKRVTQIAEFMKAVFDK